MVAFGAAVAAAPATFAQAAGNDADLHAQGEELYEFECAMCHQSSGGGVPPEFPSLVGNEALADLQLIVNNVHFGKEAMPPFPHLDETELAAVATHVRGAWGNAFGAVSGEDVAAVLGGSAGDTELTTIWSGVYTVEQAERGNETLIGACAECHGTRLDGAPLDPDRSSSPPLSRAKFLRNWDGRSLGVLHGYMSGSMPPSSPGFLSPEQYADAIAHMLASSNVPAGDTELGSGVEELSRILITMKPE